MADQRRKRLQELKELRASGKTRGSTYEVEEDNAIYDEVDNEGYREVVRERLLKDDFVVDDNGEGYVDKGGDEWESGHNYYSDEYESEGESKGKSKKIKKQKIETQSKPDGNINKMFQRAFVAAASNAVPKRKETTVEEDHDFMQDIMSGLGGSSSKLSTGLSSSKSVDKKRKVGLTPNHRKAVIPQVKREIVANVPSSPPQGASEEVPMDNEDYRPDIMDIDTGVFSDHEDNQNAHPFPPEVSSPAMKAAYRKAEREGYESEEDDTYVPVTVGLSSNEQVNISSTKPVANQQNLQVMEQQVTNSKAAADSQNRDSWLSVEEKLKLVEDSPEMDVKLSDYSKAELENVLEEDGSLNIFWTDHAEVSNNVVLFGKSKLKKTGQFISTMVQVCNLYRTLYFLPKDECSAFDVYNEIDELLKSHVKEFKAKPVTKKYCFELQSIPREAEYLEVLLPLDNAHYMDNLCNVSAKNTYSHVFGSTSSPFEQLALTREIKGPCWLNIKDPNALPNSSWCKVELTVDSPSRVTPVRESEAPLAPPMNIMSLSIRTILSGSSKRQEIVMVSGRVYKNLYHDTTTSYDKLPCTVFSEIRPIEKIYPPGFERLLTAKKRQKTITTHKDERSLLESVIAQIDRYDPDIIIGHQLESIHLSVLLHRLHDNNTNFWSKIGRLKRQYWPSGFGRSAREEFYVRQLFTGRLLCDISNNMGKSVTLKCDTWSLKEMCELYLDGAVRTEVEINALKCDWNRTAQGLYDFIVQNEVDSYFVAAIAFKIQILALSMVLTNLAGNTWSRTLEGSRSDRNEYILLHEFTKHGYIVPDKQNAASRRAAKNNNNGDNNGNNINNTNNNNSNNNNGVKANSTAKYTGGLVLDPIKGLHRNIVLVMDYLSLYPSIIQEFNICFTTVDRSACHTAQDEIPPVPDKLVKQGIFPRLIENLVRRRREVKKNMKDPNATEVEKAQWDIKQQALKLTANSMYGCLGFTESRFYALPLAMLTTAKGREILTNTKELAEEKMLQVVYGDTDSVMINTNVTDYDQAVKIGEDFQKVINEQYTKLEIEIDNVFQRILIHAKKKYAAVNMVKLSDGQIKRIMEIKGLDLKRREYCQASKEASMYILDRILFEEDSELVVEKIHDYLTQLGTDVRDNKIPLAKFLIRNMLGKDPNDYNPNEKLPFVHVAKRRRQNGEIIRKDDVISYIVTGSEEDGHVADRSNTINEVRKDSMKVDFEFYLSNQIFRPVERLCGLIEGTDVIRLAECLGLDARKHKITISGPSGTNQPYQFEIQSLESTISDEDRFRNVSKFHLICGSCSHNFEFRGLEKSNTDVISSSGVNCPSCQSPIKMTRLNAQLECKIRKEITTYYAGWVVCDDSSCGSRTRQVGVYGRNCVGQDEECRGTVSYEMTDKTLYNQLLYLDSLFDMDKAKKTALSTSSSETSDLSITEVNALAEQNRERFEVPRQVISKYLSNCGRRYVDMHSIFSFV